MKGSNLHLHAVEDLQYLETDGHVQDLPVDKDVKEGISYVTVRSIAPEIILNVFLLQSHSKSNKTSHWKVD